MNLVILIGHLTSDPELKQNEKFTQCKFTLAVNRLKEGADFISCIAWNKQAEAISKYLKKGSQVAIEGRIQTGNYEKDGVKHYTTDVIVQSLNFIGSNEPVAKGKEEDIVKQETDDPWKDMGTNINTDEIVLDDKDLPF